MVLKALTQEVTLIDTDQPIKDPCSINNVLICSPIYISFILFPCLYFRHVIFAPSSHNKYAGESFPGIYDALFDIENSFDPESSWNEVRRQISNAAFTVNAAAEILRPPAWSILICDIYVQLWKNTQNVTMRKIFLLNINVTLLSFEQRWLW